MPLPLLLADISQMEIVAQSVPQLAWRLAERFWPGSLTLVLNKASSISDMVTAGGNTVAVRIPHHPIPIALIRGLGTPITGTSANLSGRPNPLTAQGVREQIGERIDFIIDGGRCGGAPSTIVDVTGEVPVILREGAIPKEEIEEICVLP